MRITAKLRNLFQKKALPILFFRIQTIHSPSGIPDFPQSFKISGILMREKAETVKVFRILMPVLPAPCPNFATANRAETEFSRIQPSGRGRQKVSHLICLPPQAPSTPAGPPLGTMEKEYLRNERICVHRGPAISLAGSPFVCQSVRSKLFCCTLIIPRNGHCLSILAFLRRIKKEKKAPIKSQTRFIVYLCPQTWQY